MDQLYSENQVLNFVFKSLTNSLHANLCITDIDTDEVIFASGCGKDTARTEHQDVKDQLLYEHYDSLIKWLNELTDMLNHQAGKRIEALGCVDQLSISQRDREKTIEAFDYNKEYLYDALIESTDDYIYIGNMKTGTFRYPPAMVKAFGLPGEIIPNAAAIWGDFIHPNDMQSFLEANQMVVDGRTEYHNIEYRAKNRKGNWVWLRCRGRMIRDEQGEPDLFTGMITNLGRKNKIDHATGLHNKFELEEKINHQIISHPLSPFGIMLLGMDDFKHINDLYDRVFGDKVIHVTSQKVAAVLPDDAQIFRMDGDEFCILIQNCNPTAFEQIYSKIHQTFQYQQESSGKKYYCTLSAGCTCYPGDGKDYLDLIKFANYSLEYSKNQGKNCMTVFSEKILSHKERTLELTEILRNSIEHDFQGFSLHYQPQVMAGNGKVVGAEALARWTCEKYGVISPAEFIPLLEKNNLIVPAGKWIFRKAVAQCGRWLTKNPQFTMSVNLSYLQVIEPDFIAFIRRNIEKLGVPYDNIVVELTETCLVKEEDNIREIFCALQRLGICVAMDDFGTGYSSLGVLKNTPVDVVKIDQTFVRGLCMDAFDATFIRFIVALCHDVGKEVCVEGVETLEEYTIVKQSGLEYIQGYYFGRPAPPEEFEQLYLMWV